MTTFKKARTVLARTYRKFGVPFVDACRLAKRDFGTAGYRSLIDYALAHDLVANRATCVRRTADGLGINYVDVITFRNGTKLDASTYDD